MCCIMPTLFIVKYLREDLWEGKCGVYPIRQDVVLAILGGQETIILLFDDAMLFIERSNSQR